VKKPELIPCFSAAAVALATLLAFVAPAMAGETPEWQSEEGPPPMTFAVDDWTTTLDGYVRTGLTMVGLEGDKAPEFIGNNNGFALLNMRFGIDVKYLEDLEMRVQLDGAADSRESINDAVGHQLVSLKDAYGRYNIGPFLGLLVGQSKPPVDVEAMQSTKGLMFIRRSIVSEGVEPGEGIERPGNDGLDIRREVGLNLLSDVIDFGPVGLRYHLAMTNGAPSSMTRNDNNLFAYYGRLEFHLRNQIMGDYKPGSFLVLGGSAAYNQKTDGELPNQLSVDDFLWQADLHFAAFGVDGLAEVIGRKRSYPDTGQGEQETLGIVAQLGYTLSLDRMALSAGYRFASLDPFKGDSSDLLMGDDKLTHHTIGLGYARKDLPVAFKVDYTLTAEEAAVAIDNDLLEVLMQFVW